MIPKKKFSKVSDSKKTKLRAELFHRFLFMMLRFVIDKARTGMLIQSTLVSPQLLMVVCDQPQERKFLALKSGRTLRFCSLCLALSGQGARDVVADFEEMGADEGDFCNERITPFEDPSCTQDFVGCSDQRRDTKSIIEASLVVVSPEAILPSLRPLSRGQIQNAQKKAKEYLTAVSAQLYYSALAAMPGVGSPPYRLYSTVAFDLLHVMDLGIARIIPEKVCEILARTEYKDHGSKSSLIGTLNQRFIDLPAGALVTRKAVFLQKTSEVQAGMTGYLRRMSVPFLWVVLLGIHPRKEPDQDLLIQSALQLNHVYMMMRGINEPTKKKKRSLEDIDCLQKEASLLTRMLLQTFHIVVIVLYQ